MTGKEIDNPPKSRAPPTVDVAGRLNDACHCIMVDRVRLMAALGRSDDPHALASLLATHPHLFSDSAMFVASAQVADMQRLVTAVGQVVALPAWQQIVLQDAPDNARIPAVARGMFMGYDFHLGVDGPQLIEINTNAGGALLNAALHAAQVACCAEVADALVQDASAAAEADFVSMFRAEWQLARGNGAPPLGPDHLIAIVDDHPQTQFLLPEFERFVTLLTAHNLRARIVDASALTVRDNALWHNNDHIDFVYNRLTDFALDEPHHAALAEAWQRDLAVITPHPRAHALYADKRNLVALTDAGALRRLGVDEETIAILLAGIPRTVRVSAANAADLWATRREWFFKPATGYGSKAAYRGDKLTKNKWQEILAAIASPGGDYVAQKLVPPSERTLLVDGELRALKVDIRNYVYDGRVQLISARLYQGQTTNFRTPGGGFAAVFAVPG